MATKNSATKKVLLLLLKDLSATHTVTSLAKELKLSRVGMWKILKRLQEEKFMILTFMGSGKTSTYTVNLNWDNVLVGKSLALYLTEEALKQRRWRVNFAELEEEVDFLILYGSILYSTQQANDVDIVSVVPHKRKFIKIENIINKIQKTQSRKIHAINCIGAEFKQELVKRNRAFLDAVKKGVILFGQEEFVQFMREVRAK